jgi:hypothetical protein
VSDIEGLSAASSHLTPSREGSRSRSAHVRRVSLLFAIAAASVAILWAVIVYVAIRWSLHARSTHSAAISAAAAAAAALVVVVVLTSTPRASALVAGDLQGARSVSCAPNIVPAAGVAQGAVDIFVAEPGDVPVSAAAVIEPNRLLVIRGWGTDAPPRNVLAAVCLLVDGTLFHAQIDAYGTGRGDVATFYNQPAVSESGYEIRADTTGLAPGSHVFTIVGIDSRGRAGALAAPQHITIR